MKIKIKRLARDFNMAAYNEEGNSLLMDSSPEFGGKSAGMRPMQLLLSALGGCSAIDVISILEKQKQNLISFDIEVEAERTKTKDYALFKNIVLHFKLKGDLDPGKVNRAVKLSLDKYCSVSKILAPTATITYKISIN